VLTGTIIVTVVPKGDSIYGELNTNCLNEAYPGQVFEHDGTLVLDMITTEDSCDLEGRNMDGFVNYDLYVLPASGVPNGPCLWEGECCYAPMTEDGWVWGQRLQISHVVALNDVDPQNNFTESYESSITWVYVVPGGWCPILAVDDPSGGIYSAVFQGDTVHIDSEDAPVSFDLWRQVPTTCGLDPEPQIMQFNVSASECTDPLLYATASTKVLSPESSAEEIRAAKMAASGAVSNVPGYEPVLLRILDQLEQ
jgi:hypothetical protein